MPFGLKNVRDTYQRAMITIFYYMIHKSMEYYMDDTLAKYNKRKNHLEDLGLIIDPMERLKIRLNPKRYTFGVTLGKLLEYIILAKGIKVYLKKVQAIMDMSTTKNISQMRSLQGCLQYFRRFIS